MRRMFFTWSPPVSQFPTGETRATRTARSNSYHARGICGGECGREELIVGGAGCDGKEIGLIERASSSSSKSS
jgi:hypothetical protein